MNMNEIVELVDKIAPDDGSYFREEPIPEPIKLEEGIYLQDLVSGKNTEFTLRVPKDFVEIEEESDESYFSPDQLLLYSRPECAGFDETGDHDDNFNDTPFDTLASKMIDVVQGGKLKKRVMKEGEGEVCTPKAIVTFHYNGYREYEDEPYDSTHLRRNPMTVRLNQGDCLIGLEMGVQTMKKGEVCQLLVHPDLAFGKFGCPPRVPSNAHILFEVTLVSFEDAETAEMFDNKTREEVGQAEFSKVLAAAKVKHHSGKDLCNKKALHKGAKKFEEAINLLDKIHSIPSEKEQLEHQTFLHILHTNLAIIYNTLDEPAKACTHSRLALEIQPNKPKTYLHYGRALIMLGDYKEAKIKLQTAHKFAPSNDVINKELSKLDDIWNKNIQTERDIAFRMVQDCRITTPEEQRLKNLTEKELKFMEMVTEKLDNFEKSTISCISFPPGLGINDERFLNQEATRRNLKFQMISGIDGGGTHVYISKPQPV